MADENGGDIVYEVDMDIAGLVSGAAKVDAVLDGVSKSADNTGKKLGDLDKKTDSAGSSLSTLTSIVKSIDDTLKSMASTSREASNAVDSTASSSSEAAAVIAALNQQIKLMEGAQSSSASAAGRLESSLKEIASNSREASVAIQSTASSSSEAAAVISALNQQIQLMQNAQASSAAATSRLETSINAVTTAIQTMGNQTSSTSAQITAVERIIDGLGNQVAILEQEMQAGARSAAILAAQLRAGDNASEKQKQTIAELTGRLYDMKNGTDAAVKSGGGFKSTFQQAGYQVQDFIVQVQGGQSALVAFSQQGSQLAGAFGPSGAIIGAFIALGSVLTGVLMSALGNTGNEMDKLSKAADALNKVVTINSQGVAALSNDYARLAVTNATLAAQLRDNAIANYEKAVRDTGKSIQSIVKDQSSWFGSLQGGSASVVALGEVLGTLNIKTDSFRDAFAEASKTGLGVNNMASTLTATVSMLTGQFDIGDDAAFGLAKRLNDLAKNPSPQALSSLIDYMNTLTPTTKAGADALTELETKLLSAGAAMQEAQDRSEALKKQLAELKTEAQNANFENVSKQLETQRIALTQGQQAAKEYAISQQDLTEAQKSQLITASRQVGMLEQEKKARDEAAAAAKRQASSAASAAASVAQKLQQLQEKAALSASSTKELSREQAILQAQQSLGKSATQEQINLAGQYAATAYDNAVALKAQTEAEKKRTQAQQNYTKLQGQNNPISGLDNQFASDMQQLNEYATMYPQKIAEIEATRAGIEKKYRQQRIDAMYTEWAQQNAYTTAAAAAFDSFGQTAGNALTGLITGSMTLSDALRSIGSNILSSVINAFVQMGVEWLKSYIVGTAGMTASVAAGTAGAATLAAAWAPAAALASLATGGANAIPAQAGIVATAGVAQGLAVAGMRKNGGPVAAGSMYRVGEGGMPEIYQASNGNQYMIPGDNGSVISNKDIGSVGGAAHVSVYNYVTNNSSSAYASSTATSDENGNITIQTIVQDIEQGGEIGQAIGRNFNTSRRATE